MYNSLRMETWQKIKIREEVIDTIRIFFKNQGFREVFTPILVPIPSIEPNLEVFETQLRTAKGLKRKAYMIMSPEFSIKKLLAAGVGSCFEIAHCFRNEEEANSLHNPEFTMLEWYRVNANYFDVMNDFEDLFLKIIGRNELEYQGKTYDITKPWPRISIADFPKVADEDFYKMFFNEVEPKLAKSNKPYFIYDYPISQASLSRPKKDDPNFAERFEVFLGGVELGNCFSELTDWKEQKKRFEIEKEERKKLGKTNYPIDNDLIEALKSGLPEVSGIAVGVDRLIMLAADVPGISDIILFPGSELFDL